MLKWVSICPRIRGLSLCIALLITVLCLISILTCSNTLEAAVSIYPNGYSSDKLVYNGFYSKLTGLGSEQITVEVTIEAELTALNRGVFLITENVERQVILDRPSVGAGSTIITGPVGMAELIWPDGSSILINANTVVKIEEAVGQTLQTEAMPESMLFAPLLNSKDYEGQSSYSSEVNLYYIKLALNKGMIYGSLVPLGKNDFNIMEKGPGEPVRVEVDMPWGVAGIRGTVWMNEVGDNKATTSVLSGSVEVTAGGVTVVVNPGQAIDVNLEGSQFNGPFDMKTDDYNKWRAAKDWVEKVVPLERNPKQEIMKNLEEKPPASKPDTPGQSGNTPGQSGSEPPGLAGTTPGKSGTTPGNSGSAPGQSGESPGNSGSAPGQSGGSPGNSGSAPGKSGESPGNSGSAPGNNN